MKEIRISLWNHLKHLTPIVIAVTIWCLLTIYDKSIHEKVSYVILVFWFYILANVIVVLYLHIEYFILNRGVKIKYDTELLLYIKKDITIELSKKDIRKISMHHSFFYKQPSGIFASDNYCFFEIIMNSGKRIIITSLLDSNFEKKINSDFVIKKRLFASVYL